MKVNTETIIRLQQCTITITLYADGKLHLSCRDKVSWRSIKHWLFSLIGRTINDPAHAIVFDTEIPTFETNKLRFMLCGRSFQELTAYRMMQRDVVDFFEKEYGVLSNQQIIEALLRKVSSLDSEKSENVYDWIEVFLLMLYAFDKQGFSPYELVEVAAQKLDIYRESSGSLATLLAVVSKRGRK